MKKQFVSIFILTIAFQSIANTFNVPSTYSTIQAGINAASNGDTVLVEDDIITYNIESVKGYSQGGVVFGDYAFFSANIYEFRVQPNSKVPKHSQYPFVSMVRLSDFKIIRTFNFRDTYDSSPVIITSDTDTIIVAHEYKKQRSVAYSIKSGNFVWKSKDNQPGLYFFGYSYYENNDSKTIFVSSNNGLHAISSEDGIELWSVETRSTGGVTPAVDQLDSMIYYQADNQIYKLNALSGNIENSYIIEGPYSQCISWNTILAEYDNQKFIATYWYNPYNGKGAIRVFDTELNLVWEKLELTTSKKATLTYHNSGKVIIGCGNGWKPFMGSEWKKINAYNIKTGKIDWSCDLSKFEFNEIMNIPAYNDFLYAETQDDVNIASSKIFKLNALTGDIEEIFYYGKPVTSCATSIIAKGFLFSGNLYKDELNIIKIATNATSTWPGPFGDPQKNQMSITEKGVQYNEMKIAGDTIKSYTTKGYNNE